MSHKLRFERLFDAAPEEVFDALTDAEGLEEMYGRDEPGWIVESEGEVRVGGTWSATFGPSREELYRFVHTYEVVDRPRRIAFSSEQQTSPDGPILEADVEIMLEGRDGKTLLTLVERGYPSAEERDLHMIGTPHAYDRVERFIRRTDGKARPKTEMSADLQLARSTHGPPVTHERRAPRRGLGRLAARSRSRSSEAGSRAQGRRRFVRNGSLHVHVPRWLHRRAERRSRQRARRRRRAPA